VVPASTTAGLDVMRAVTPSTNLPAMTLSGAAIEKGNDLDA
jgi:hypothetical protein